MRSRLTSSMPRTGLLRRFNELKRSREGQVTAAALVQLARAYQVSVQALTLRLEDLPTSSPRNLGEATG